VIGRYNATTKAISNDGIGVWTAPLVDAHHNVYLGTASGHILGFSYSGTKLFDVATAAIVASYPAMTADGTLLIGSDNRPSTPSTPDPAPPGHPVWRPEATTRDYRRVAKSIPTFETANGTKYVTATFTHTNVSAFPSKTTLS